MFNYDNISFTHKLPEDFSDLEKLKNLKTLIDRKLKNLERKTRSSEYMSNIVKQEKNIKCNTPTVYVVPIENF